MQEENAAKLLAHVMNWGSDLGGVAEVLYPLRLLADYKYDHYQRFAPGKRFIESLALWINQFDPADREEALAFVQRRLVFFSDEEMSHLVGTAYPDLIVQERMRLVAEESDIGLHRVVEISKHPRFTDLRLKSLYLGLSDGARTNELRRASDGEISNEQIWQAYELGEDKAEDMIKELKKALHKTGKDLQRPLFNLIWLLDDFSGSGNTYIRFDNESKSFKGKLPKIYDRLTKGDLVEPQHYEVFLLLYVATRQAIDHIEYWSERYTSEKGYKPLQVRVLCIVEPETSLNKGQSEFSKLLTNNKYNDKQAADEHFRKGGTDDPKLGFAGCALPLVLAHNTPNNSVFILWGPEHPKKFFGLFPRVSRHREF